MSQDLNDLKRLISERKRDLQTQHMILIEQDAPKIKMSVITGRILELNNIESEIELIEKKAKEPR
jgi:hypothetical protein